jgi:hypothetical protein
MSVSFGPVRIEYANPSPAATSASDQTFVLTWLPNRAIVLVSAPAMRARMTWLCGAVDALAATPPLIRRWYGC